MSAQKRRELILAAAVRAFAAEGYDGASMDRVARYAQITKPVLYDHFASKEALFRAVLESIRDRLIARGEAILDDGGAPSERLHRGVDAFLRFVEEEPQAARVLLSRPRDATAAQASREVQAGASAAIARLLTTVLHDAPAWRQLAATEFLKGGLHAIAEWWLANPDHPREGLVDAVVRIARIDVS